MDLADPAEVRAASDEVSAEALQREFLELAEEMQAQDVDAQTIGTAMDMVLAEAEVADAARQVARAERLLADAEESLRSARAMPVSDPCTGCHDAKAAAVAAAEEDVAAAVRQLQRAKERLREALAVAADLAASMRDGLRRRHGGIAEAASASPVSMADRNFYVPGGN